MTGFCAVWKAWLGFGALDWIPGIMCPEHKGLFWCVCAIAPPLPSSLYLGYTFSLSPKLEKITHGREEKTAEGKLRVGVGGKLQFLVWVWLLKSGYSRGIEEMEFIQCLWLDTGKMRWKDASCLNLVPWAMSNKWVSQQRPATFRVRRTTDYQPWKSTWNYMPSSGRESHRQWVQLDFSRVLEYSRKIERKKAESPLLECSEKSDRAS